MFTARYGLCPCNITQINVVFKELNMDALLITLKFVHKMFIPDMNHCKIPVKLQCVPLATEPGISLIILPLMRILQRNLNRSTFVV